MSEITKIYLKNSQTGEIACFGCYQPGWSPASAEEPPLSEEEIDGFLLEKAQSEKVMDLTADLGIFCEIGFEYLGEISCQVWELDVTYSRKALVLGSDEKNYKSLKDNNLNNDPFSKPEWWEEFYPVFKTNDKTTQNVQLKDRLPLEAPERYIYRDKDKSKIDFVEAIAWLSFVDEILEEKDRIMGKYNDYYEQIDLCLTIAEVGAIVIDFSV